MRREPAQSYRDQFELLADHFELIRKRGDAYNIRTEALETERMVRYSERTGYESERSHLLEIYRDIEAEVAEREARVQRRAALTDTRFPLDHFRERHGLSDEEMSIVLVLLYNESVGRSHARFVSGNDILNLLFPNPVSALRASRHLDATGTLFREGLVRATADEDAGNFLRAAYEVTETTLREVLGASDRDGFRRRDMQQGSAADTVADGPFRSVEPRVDLDQVVLPADLRERLEEAIWQAEQGEDLFRTWGLDRVLEKGRGTILLFGGPPGTGKSMTAEAVARRLDRPLYVADYSRLESKWIGETEKNIVGVFRAAAAANAVLLLDEADAVLAGRLDGAHYNDRAYNRQVSLLLTEMEAFEGVCILTTNREVTLDDGLARRIAARFTFPVPEAAERRRIWSALLPDTVPLDDDVDLDDLARRYPLAGGHIKNAVLSAVRRAARRDGRLARVRQDDFVRGASEAKEGFGPDDRPIGFRDEASPGFA